jgi:hypothetical protein
LFLWLVASSHAINDINKTSVAQQLNTVQDMLEVDKAKELLHSDELHSNALIKIQSMLGIGAFHPKDGADFAFFLINLLATALLIGLFIWNTLAKKRAQVLPDPTIVDPEPVIIHKPSYTTCAPLKAVQKERSLKAFEFGFSTPDVTCGFVRPTEDQKHAATVTISCPAEHVGDNTVMTCQPKNDKDSTCEWKGDFPDCKKHCGPLNMHNQIKDKGFELSTQDHSCGTKVRVSCPASASGEETFFTCEKTAKRHEPCRWKGTVPRCGVCEPIAQYMNKARPGSYLFSTSDRACKFVKDPSKPGDGHFNGAEVTVSCGAGQKGPSQRLKCIATDSNPSTCKWEGPLPTCLDDNSGEALKCPPIRSFLRSQYETYRQLFPSSRALGLAVKRMKMDLKIDYPDKPTLSPRSRAYGPVMEKYMQSHRSCQASDGSGTTDVVVAGCGPTDISFSESVHELSCVRKGNKCEWTGTLPQCFPKSCKPLNELLSKETMARLEVREATTDQAIAMLGSDSVNYQVFVDTTGITVTSDKKALVSDLFKALEKALDIKFQGRKAVLHLSDLLQRGGDTLISPATDRTKLLEEAGIIEMSQLRITTETAMDAGKVAEAKRKGIRALSRAYSDVCTGNKVVKCAGAKGYEAAGEAYTLNLECRTQQSDAGPLCRWYNPAEIPRGSSTKPPKITGLVNRVLECTAMKCGKYNPLKKAGLVVQNIQQATIDEPCSDYKSYVACSSGMYKTSSDLTDPETVTCKLNPREKKCEWSSHSLTCEKATSQFLTPCSSDFNAFLQTTPISVVDRRPLSTLYTVIPGRPGDARCGFRSYASPYAKLGGKDKKALSDGALMALRQDRQRGYWLDTQKKASSERMAKKPPVTWMTGGTATIICKDDPKARPTEIECLYNSGNKRCGWTWFTLPPCKKYCEANLPTAIQAWDDSVYSASSMTLECGSGKFTASCVHGCTTATTTVECKEVTRGKCQWTGSLPECAEGDSSGVESDDDQLEEDQFHQKCGCTEQPSFFNIHTYNKVYTVNRQHSSKEFNMYAVTKQNTACSSSGEITIRCNTPWFKSTNPSLSEATFKCRNPQNGDRCVWYYYKDGHLYTNPMAQILDLLKCKATQCEVPYGDVLDDDLAKALMYDVEDVEGTATETPCAVRSAMAQCTEGYSNIEENPSPRLVPCQVTSSGCGWPNPAPLPKCEKKYVDPSIVDCTPWVCVMGRAPDACTEWVLECEGIIARLTRMSLQDDDFGLYTEMAFNSRAWGTLHRGMMEQGSVHVQSTYISDHISEWLQDYMAYRLSLNTNTQNINEESSRVEIIHGGIRHYFNECERLAREKDKERAMLEARRTVKAKRRAYDKSKLIYDEIRRIKADQKAIANLLARLKVQDKEGTRPYLQAKKDYAKLEKQLREAEARLHR